MELPQLEPMKVGQILRRSFKLYRHNFLRFVAIIAVVYIPWYLFKMPLPFLLFQQVETTSGSELPWAWLICMLILGSLATFLVNAAIFKSVSMYYLGKKPTCRQAYKSVWARFRTILAAAILLAVFLVSGGAGAFMISFLYKLDIFLSIWIICLVLSVVAPIIVLVLVMVWFAVTAQCIMAEDMSAWRSMKRSKKLVKGNMGRVFALIILLMAMGLILQWPINRLARLIGNLPAELSSAGATAVQSLLSWAGSILIAPISAIAMAHLYYDLRSRKESLETQVNAEVEAVKPWWETWPKSW